MKNLIALFLALAFAVTLVGNTEPVTKTPHQKTLHVYAYSGLKLRTQPTTQSEVVKIIPYGDKVTLLEQSGQHETIEWMSGEWVKVSHGESEGYVFEGFISELPIPNYKFEMTLNDLDLTYPLLAWAEYHYDEVQNADTIMNDEVEKVVQHLENNLTLTRTNTKHRFYVNMELSNIKIEDAYNLVKAMLLTKAEKEVFENNSIFIHDNEGLMHRIKVNVEHPLEIRKLHDGKIKILASSYHHGC